MAYSTTYPMVLVLLIFPLHILAQTMFTIPLGSSLTANEATTPWLSQSGHFAFGFKQIQGKNQFLLCICYAKIKDTTIVWYANDGYPVLPGSMAELNPQNGLILRDPQGKMLWSTGKIVANNLAYAVINDTGNFVLVGVDSSVLWQSFRYPTYTILPTQILEIDNKLVSRESESLFVPGRFYLRMLSNGNLVLVTQSKPSNFDYDSEYYNSHTSDPGNEDKGSGVCGYNNVCHLGENQRPYCECPKGYLLIDPNNKYGSCKPKFVPSCDKYGQENPEDLYDFDVVTDVDWPLSDFERIYPSAEEECRKSCLEDCFCAVAIYRSNSCWKKRLPLSNGRVDSTLNVKAFLKIGKFQHKSFLN